MNKRAEEQLKELEKTNPEMAEAVRGLQKSLQRTLDSFGYIPGNKQVDHLCNQRLCCNPQHLELVTHQTNQRRRAARSKS